MASGEGQLNPSTSGDADGDHHEDFCNDYGPPLPTQEELREMEHRRLVGEATKLMLNFAKDPKLAKYMSETAFQDVQAQWKATTTSPPKPDSKKQYSEKELEEEIDARLARILGAQKQGKKHDRKRKKSTDFLGYMGRTERQNVCSILVRMISNRHDCNRGVIEGDYNVFKRGVYTGTAYANDGCATFFRRDCLSLVKKYEVEFNKAAQSLTETAIPPAQKKTALSRLLKDNVALIVVLEARDANHGAEGGSAPGKRQLLCVANTHIHANPELKDVKLWQVQTLLKGLEKIAASADIPMLVCGDFNSVPGSAPHVLLASGRVDPIHPDLSTDPLGILRPTSRLCHQLPLVSAYSAFTRLERQRRRMDPSSNEPLFTNCTRDFLGTLDYIFYTADSLVVESLLELLDEESLRRDTALPSPEWSSDHIALLAQFRYKPRPLR
ncbi:hypothetical protein L7F22_043231 [Adiantum nelumboides]|nr:hypothetical protein [Adiantum nelumboides]